MSWVAVAIGGGAVVGYLGSQLAANSASDAMQDASQRASDTQLQMFNVQRHDQEPWRQAGAKALGQLQDGMEDINRDFTMKDFQRDPGYDFRLSEGMKALEHSAAARGSLSSGATMKAISKYGQNVAADEYQNAYNRFTGSQTNRFNRLSSIAGLGQTANQANAQAGQNAANQIGANQLAVGNTQAAAAMNNSNNLNSMIGTGTNAFMNYQMMNKFNRPPNTSDPN